MTFPRITRPISSEVARQSAPDQADEYNSNRTVSGLTSSNVSNVPERPETLANRGRFPKTVVSAPSDHPDTSAHRSGPTWRDAVVAVLGAAAGRLSATTTAWMAPDALTRAGIRTGPKNPDPASFRDSLRGALDVSGKVSLGHAIGTTVVGPLVQSAVAVVIVPEDVKAAFPDPIRQKNESRPDFRARKEAVRSQRERMAAKQNALNGPDKLPAAMQQCGAFAVADFISRQQVAPKLWARNAVLLGVGAGLASMANSSLKLATRVDGHPAFRPARAPQPLEPAKAIAAAAKQIVAPPSTQFETLNEQAFLDKLRNGAGNAGKAAANIGSNLIDRTAVHFVMVGGIRTKATMDVRRQKAKGRTPAPPGRKPLTNTQQSLKGAAVKAGILEASGFFQMVPGTVSTKNHLTRRDLPYARTAEVIRDGTSSLRGQGPRDLHALLADRHGIHPVVEKVATVLESAHQIATLPSKVVVQGLLDTPPAVASVLMQGADLAISAVRQVVSGGRSGSKPLGKE